MIRFLRKQYQNISKSTLKKYRKNKVEDHVLHLIMIAKSLIMIKERDVSVRVLNVRVLSHLKNINLVRIRRRNQKTPREEWKSKNTRTRNKERSKTQMEKIEKRKAVSQNTRKKERTRHQTLIDSFNNVCM